MFYYLIVWVHFCFLKIYIYLYVQNVVYTYTYSKKMYIKYVFFLLISKKKIFLFEFGNDFCLACFSLRNDVHTTHCSFRFRRFSFIILCATDLTIWVDGSSYKHAYHYIVMPGEKSRTDCIHRNAQNRPELRKSEQKPMTPRPTSLHANEGSVVNGFFRIR